MNGVCEFVRMIVRRVDVIWEFGFECSGWMSGTRGCAMRLECALALGEMSLALGELVFRGVDFRDRDGSILVKSRLRRIRIASKTTYSAFGGTL